MVAVHRHWLGRSGQSKVLRRATPVLASLHSCVSPSLAYARTKRSATPPSPLPCAVASTHAPPPHLRPPPHTHRSTLVSSTSPTHSHPHSYCGKLRAMFVVAATTIGAPPCSRSLRPCSIKLSRSLLSHVKDSLESRLAHITNH